MLFFLNAHLSESLLLLLEGEVEKDMAAEEEEEAAEAEAGR